ncbi:Fumarate reductase flavoprotein subunit [Achromobacter veterisilvae]|uniref:Fumarate reductase flavoprotein subunit n=1 Tax=Achromobacter veterisilvae TaxID=2069367 RepID=A0A446CFN8_9BURK|nr:FAD-dependent tricarballylate dehydrogenase TcuA [Achromobacter veterisilvae]SSW66690.1 Fumarate reductase flavoprotein subunit [Achromobacter veterisilvae]
MEIFDVAVIGGGNAALCAALSAQESGARVIVIERAPKDNRGGSSAFTGGAFRIAYKGNDDLKTLIPDLSEDELANSDFGSYTEDQFYNEAVAMSGYRADADVLDTVVTQSFPTMMWMRSHGVRFMPIYGRQSFKVDGKNKFWGGLTVEVSGGGLGLMQALYDRAEKLGLDLRYGARACGLEREGDAWTVALEENGATRKLRARAVVLATGGFHANVRWRAQYLGPNWDLAKVRGSRYNTGDGIDMAVGAGAIAHGNWTGCHAVFYDLNAPAFGDIDLLNQQKNYFNLGIVVNADGRRFVDEGLDFRNYTYSGMGARVLAQPGAVAWQVFDAKTAGLLPDEYRVKHATRLQADTLEELAAQMEGINPRGFLQTVREFNDSIDQSVPFNPAIKDGRATRGLAVPKSNWAHPLDTGPFVAYAVTCGITCTYAGVKVNPNGQVLDGDDHPLPGLYAAGEMVGGLYYVKYAGGIGLTAGSVLGRISGAHAASLARA